MMSSSKKVSPHIDIVIDLLHDNNSYSKDANNLASKYSDTFLINEEVFSNTILKTVTSKHIIRVYIVGHCGPGSDNLYTKNKAISYADLAKNLTRLIGDNNNVMINLVACYAGVSRDKSVDNSFAAKLHKELVSIKKKDIPVIARKSTTTVIMEPNSVFKETTKPEFSIPHIVDLQNRRDAAPINSLERSKLNAQLKKMYTRHQPGSKVIFMMDKDKNQICADAYLHFWNSHLFRLLKYKQTNAEDKAELTLLKQWNEDFKALSDDQICEAINTEIVKTDSPLKKYSNPFLQFFNGPKSVYGYKKILEEREEFVKGQSSVIKTGIIL